ncbi:MAG: YbjN domain-containing protein [Erythrobacter sp.]
MNALPQRFCRKAAVVSVLALCAIAAPASAQDDRSDARTDTTAMVRATEPEALNDVLVAAGFDTELITNREAGGGEIIRVKDADGYSSILQSDCSEAVIDFCDTIVLSTGWDLDAPLSAEGVAEANRALRYVSIYTDDEGDPFVHWAILTRREGISAPLFLNALRRYLDVVGDFAGFLEEYSGGAAEAEAEEIAAALPNGA